MSTIELPPSFNLLVSSGDISHTNCDMQLKFTPELADHDFDCTVSCSGDYGVMCNATTSQPIPIGNKRSKRKREGENVCSGDSESNSPPVKIHISLFHESSQPFGFPSFHLDLTRLDLTCPNSIGGTLEQGMEL